MTVAPDHGFAWIIALDCFLINFLTVGISRSVGILYVEFIDLYGVRREAASSPFSIRAFCTNMTGPLVGFLGLKYGIRGITAIGGLIAASGSIFCSFASDMRWTSICWGLIHGFGYGLCTCLHMLSINQYFEKYRATALGFAYSGDCFGNFVFPFLIEYLLETVTAKGTFLIIGGIFLHIIPMAMLLRNPPWLEYDKCISKMKTSSGDKVSKLENSTNSCLFQNAAESETLSGICPVTDRFNETKIDQEKNYDYFKSCGPIFYIKDASSFRKEPRGLRKDASKSSYIDDLRFSGKNKLVKKILKYNFENSDALQGIYTISEDSYKSELRNDSKIYRDRHANSQVGKECSAEDIENISYFSHTCTRSKVFENSTENVFSSSINCNMGGVENVFICDDVDEKLEEENSSTTSKVAKDFSEYANVVAKHFNQKLCLPDLKKSSKYMLGEECVPKRLLRTMHKANKDLTDVIPDVKYSDEEVKQVKNRKSNVKERAINIKNSVIKHNMVKVFIRTNMNPIFILMSLSSAAYAFLLTVILTIIVDYSLDNEIPESQAKYLIVSFSVTDLIGRLTFGQIIDKQVMKINNYLGVCMFLMGLFSAIIPFYKRFYYMLACICLYGIIQGGVAIIFPILLNTYMDKNTHSVAMGCLNFYGGLFILLLSPTIRYFRDNIGAYDVIFYISGGIVAIIGAIWKLEPFLLRLEKNNCNKKFKFETHN